MKKLLLFLFSAVTILGSKYANAQAFTIQKDTVRLTFIQGAGLQAAVDSVAPLSASVTIDWKVLSTNFPSDWLSSVGICDNKTCYPWSLLWSSGAGVLKTSNPYTMGSGTHDFHLQLNIPTGGTAGTYYLVVKQTSGSTDTQHVYAVTYTPTSVGTVSKVNSEISVYPNPTNSDINVVYDAAADIKTISVYNIIGKAMAIYKPTSDNSANLSLENVPAGVYFLRLINSHGEVVATRKFTKQ